MIRKIILSHISGNRANQSYVYSVTLMHNITIAIMVTLIIAISTTISERFQDNEREISRCLVKVSAKVVNLCCQKVTKPDLICLEY